MPTKQPIMYIDKYVIVDADYFIIKSINAENHARPSNIVASK